jgi:hypothetical protein
MYIYIYFGIGAEYEFYKKKTKRNQQDFSLYFLLMEIYSSFIETRQHF